MNPDCDNCGTTMVSGAFPYPWECPNCGGTTPKKKTAEDKKAAAKKAAETKRRKK